MSGERAPLHPEVVGASGPTPVRRRRVWDVVLAILGLLATVGTVALHVVRIRAWWLPASALVLTIIGWIVSFGLYADALTP